MAGRKIVLQGMVSINGADPVPMTFSGEAYDPNLSIGGGPIIPAPPPGSPSHPIYWPPYPDNSLPPFPSHPIVIVPPGIIDGVHPEHPIVLPIYPDNGLPIPEPPERPPGTEQWVWRLVEPWGWVLDPPGQGKPRPLP